MNIQKILMALVATVLSFNAFATDVARRIGDCPVGQLVIVGRAAYCKPEVPNFPVVYRGFCTHTREVWWSFHYTESCDGDTIMKNENGKITTEVGDNKTGEKADISRIIVFFGILFMWIGLMFGMINHGPFPVLVLLVAFFADSVAFFAIVVTFLILGTIVIGIHDIHDWFVNKKSLQQ